MDMISAICVSHASRYALLQRAIYSFAAQDYVNRELLISISDSEYFDKVKSWILDDRHEGVDLSNVYLLKTDETHVGRQVVEAFQKSSGAYIAVWSDDNLSHSSRLSSQIKKSLECATVVSMSFCYFYDSNELFVTDYCQPGRDITSKCAVSSLIVPRDHFFGSFLQQMHSHYHWSSGLVRKLASMFPSQGYRHLSSKEDGFLFMQGVHGDNQRGPGYHRILGSQLPLTWTREKVLAHADKIDATLAGYMFPSKSVDVAGRDVAACKITGSNIRQWPKWFDTTFSSDKTVLSIEGLRSWM